MTFNKSLNPFFTCHGYAILSLCKMYIKAFLEQNTSRFQCFHYDSRHLYLRHEYVTLCHCDMYYDL